MTDRSTSKPSDVASRRAAWQAERLDPALRRAPERRSRFSTISDMPIDGLYGPWSMAEDSETRIGLPGDPPFNGPWIIELFRHPAHREPHEEPVKLGLGQRERALVLDRVLRGQHDERSRQGICHAVNRHLALFHRLK